MYTTLKNVNGAVVSDIVNEVTEQLDCIIDDTIHQHYIYDDEYKQVKKEVLRIILENIEDYYDEQ